jgi:glutamate/aspartate transport system substrate-binding protein
MTFSFSNAFAQANDLIAKAKTDGWVTLGVRDSSGALSYFIGDGKYGGYHVDVCQRIAANLERAAGRKLEIKYLAVTSQNRIPLLQNGCHRPAYRIHSMIAVMDPFCDRRIGSIS